MKSTGFLRNSYENKPIGCQASNTRTSFKIHFLSKALKLMEHSFVNIYFKCFLTDA